VLAFVPQGALLIAVLLAAQQSARFAVVAGNRAAELAAVVLAVLRGANRETPLQ
jgi:putative Ca2+/H+ antiporter (TMEM165/GDT1 family)